MTDKELDDYVAQMFSQTEFAVEATSCEMQLLWEKFCNQTMHKTPTAVYDWEQFNPGYWHQIGAMNGLPICVSVFWFKVNGMLVAFYEGTSRLVDHMLIEEWIKSRCPKNCQYTNANNFHNVLTAVRNKA